MSPLNVTVNDSNLVLFISFIKTSGFPNSGSFFAKFFHSSHISPNEASNESKRLTLATTGTTFLSRLLKKFLILYRDIKIRQFVTTTDEAIEYLKTGQADFSITSPPIYDESIETHILDYDEILLAVPINHKLANRKSVDLAELKNENFIDLIGHYNFRKITDKMCEMAGFKPNIIFEGEIPLMAEMLKAGQGIALIPKSLSNFYPNFPAVVIKIEKPIYKRVIAISWYKKSYESQTEKYFREFTIAYFSK